VGGPGPPTYDIRPFCQGRSSAATCPKIADGTWISTSAIQTLIRRGLRLPCLHVLPSPAIRSKPCVFLCSRIFIGSLGSPSFLGLGGCIPPRYENGREKSCFVRYHIPFYPDCFHICEKKRERDGNEMVYCNGNENGLVFFRPYFRNHVFTRIFPFSEPRFS
jgi:hypothetical protein